MTQSVGLVTAFIAGLFSFISPCVLPLVPAYIANLAGATAIEPGAKRSRLPALFHSLMFVAGFTVIFVFLGASVGLLGSAFTANPQLLRWIAGSLVLLLGIYIIAAWKIPWLNYEKRMNFSTGRKTGYVRSMIIGGAFALGWTPCVGPILGAILALAWSSQNVALGAELLIIYSLGMGIPFILIGLLWGFIMPLWKSINKYLGIISLVSGAILIIVGILILTNSLSIISSWFSFGSF